MAAHRTRVQQFVRVGGGSLLTMRVMTDDHALPKVDPPLDELAQRRIGPSAAWQRAVADAEGRLISIRSETPPTLA